MKLTTVLFLFLPLFAEASYFVSIKSDKANLRIGPSTDYPIEWVYVRKNMPVYVLEKYEQWRKIKDMEGEIGWMHQSLLSNKHYFITVGKTVIRNNPDHKAKIKAYVDPKIIGRLFKCENEWCKVKVENITGWIKKKHVWGVVK
ncbi:MAG: hypothetical protein HRK26_00240 [Rickettsiaceae bacterium H1]|nr:hypothetical protein [Rickettsiaceae bacterium H1]